MRLSINFKSPRKLSGVLLLGILALLAIGSLMYMHMPSTQETSLIPRKVLLSNPERERPALSPDGKWISFLAPHEGILNIWTQDRTTGEMKVLTQEKQRGIYNYKWAFDNQHILYTHDADGSENSKLYKVDVRTGINTLLTGAKGVKTKLIATSYRHPHTVLIGMNDRDPVHHDIYTLDILTGEKTLLVQNTEFSGFFCDDLKVVFAFKENPQGGTEYYQLEKDNRWTLHRTVSVDDTENTDPISLDGTQEWVYWQDSEGSDKANLVKMNLKTKERQLLFKGQKADLAYTIIHPTTKEILAVGENYLRWQVTPLTPDMKKDYKILEDMNLGEISIVSSTLDQKLWLVEFSTDTNPYSYYLYDRNTKKATFLFYDKPAWKGLPLVPMHPVEIKSRDGLTLVSYLSLPKDKKPGVPVPMILIPHGGPIGIRVEWELSPTDQYWTNRGYAVLSVNYRGSSGFGKSFIKAAYGEYAGKMHDDLIDAVNWAIKEKIADPKKIAIRGGSYGGYAALVGVTMTPDVFACAVDICGFSNLLTFFDTIPPYWDNSYESLKIWLGGDPKTPEGREILLKKSPLTYVNNIKKPLLIMQGGNDPRVKRTESDQIVAAMKEKGIPVTYILFPDEGHGFARPQNQSAEAAAMEIFFHKHLGGKLEPLGNELKESSAQILEGTVE